MSESEIPKKLGRYEIVSELGKGAMGVVYEGRDPNIGRRVALKTARRDVLAASGMAEEMMERFLREARAAGALNHPNIITIYDTDEEDGIAWIAMEFIEGKDLREMLVERRGLELNRILEIGALICDALEAAHNQGIVHRDVKPANILVTNTGSVKVADFGIAHVTDSTLTQEGALIGTPHYMSPEQFMGQNIDGRADLFSLGIIMYELLTGEKPFTGEALSTVMHHVIKTAPVPPSELNLSIPQHVDKVLLKAMAKRPQERYATAAALAAALRECQKDDPDPAVLGTETVEAGATVVSPGNADTIAGPPVAPVGQPTTDVAGDATLPSAATPDVSGDATMPSAAQPAPEGEATMPSQTAPPAASNPLSSMASRPRQSKTIAMGTGVVLVLALVVGGIFMMRGEPDGDGTTPPSNGSDLNAVGENAEVAHYDSVTVQVKRSASDEGVLGLLASTSEQADAASILDFGEEFYVRVLDLESREPVSAMEKVVNGKATIDLNQKGQQFWFELYATADADTPIWSGEPNIDLPTEPGQSMPPQTFILPPAAQ